MPDEARARHLKNTLLLLQGAKAVGIPVVCTEQYPKGLGPTLKEIREICPDLNPIEKVEFSCCQNPTAAKAISNLSRKKILVAGMETHVCVYQTVLDLIGQGVVPHIVADTCLSRSKANYKIGLSLCERAGAVLSGTETALFQLVGRAGTEPFKAVSKLVR